MDEFKPLLTGKLARTVTVETRPSVAIVEGMKNKGSSKAMYETNMSRIFEAGAYTRSRQSST